MELKEIYERKQSILEYLCKNPKGQTSISVYKETDTERGEAYAVMLELHSRGYLELHELPFAKDGDKIVFDIKVDAKPSLNGFLNFGGYVEEYENISLAKRQIKSQIDANVVVTVMSILAGVLTIGTIVVSILQYTKKPDELIQPTLQSIQKEVQSLKESQRQQMSSLEGFLKNDTVHVKISKSK